MRVADKRIFIRPALFHKPNGKSQKREAVTRGIEERIRHPLQKTFTSSLRRGLSYGDVLMDISKQPGISSSHARPNCVVEWVIKEEELLWLARCAIGTVKSADLLPDLPFLLKEAGFLDMKPKYVGGLRFLVECESIEALDRLLKEGK